MNIIDKIKQKNNFNSSKNKYGDEIINEMEIKLGLKFNDEYKICMKEFGIFSFGGHEFMGIIDSDRLNIVKNTIREKEKYLTIKKDMYVIEDLNIDSILVWQNTAGEIFESDAEGNYVKIYNNFDEYINEV